MDGSTDIRVTCRAPALLVDELSTSTLCVIGEVTLTSGARAEYYVDAKRAILRPDGFAALATLLAAQVVEWTVLRSAG